MTSSISSISAKLSTMQIISAKVSQPAQLPVELFTVIGGFLVGDLCFGSMASLNVICRSIHEETLPTLYETIIFRWSVLAFKALEEDARDLSKRWGYVRYAIIENVPGEGDEKNAMSTFGNTSFLLSIFSKLRLAIFRCETTLNNDQSGRYRSCHAVVYEDVSFTTFVPIMLSSVAARKHYSCARNPFLAFPTPNKSRNLKTYVPEKITKVTIENVGCIQPASLCDPGVIEDTFKAWSVLSCQFDLVLALSDQERPFDFHRKTLCIAAVWLFIPKVCKETASKAYIRIQNVKIYCSVTALPDVMAVSASLDPQSVMSIVLMDSTTAFKTLIPALHRGGQMYTANLGLLEEVGPPSRVYVEKASWSFPQLGRRTGSKHTMCIEFALEGQNGLSQPILARFGPTKDYFRHRYPGRSFHFVMVYPVYKLGGQNSVTAEFVLVMNRILDICDSGVAPVMLLSDKERPYGWRVIHHVRDAE